MKIVIEIVDDDYNRINSYPDGKTFYPITARLYKAVKDGTPLPKGHGRIIDEDQIAGDGGWDFSDRLMETPTIIEADIEREEV